MISDEEKDAAQLVKDPRFPVGCIEGEFDGERVVVLMLIDESETGEGVDLIPLAMLCQPEWAKRFKFDPEALGAMTKKKLIITEH